MRRRGWEKRKGESLFDRAYHHPQHVGHALTQGAFLMQPEAHISVPDAIDGRNGDRGIAKNEWSHDMDLSPALLEAKTIASRMASEPRRTVDAPGAARIGSGFCKCIPPTQLKDSICAGRVKYAAAGSVDF